MDRFVQDNEGTILFVGLIVALVVAAILEELLPRRKSSGNLKQRWFSNLGLSFVNQIGVSFLTTGAVIATAWWAEHVGVGLLAGTELGFLPLLILATLVFEFMFYWFHRALHSIPFLWRIHAIHHSDTELDFSTTLRNHPFETLVIAPFTVPIILIMGFPLVIVITYQIVKTTISILAHGNIRLPEKVDKIVRRIIITPDFHRMHHSSDSKYTNSNFSAAFPLFDYLFGTVSTQPYEDHDKMELGLEYFREPSDSRIDRLLLMPFVWRKREKKPGSGHPRKA